MDPFNPASLVTWETQVGAVRGPEPSQASPQKSAFFPAAAAKSLQSCPTLCNPMNRSTPGLPVHTVLMTGFVVEPEVR